MKEYTLAALVSVAVTLLVCRAYAPKLLGKRLFQVFLCIILCLKCIVNGYLTGTHIVMYNPGSFLGVRIGSIPVEDFLFGFSMVTLSIVFWERLQRP